MWQWTPAQAGGIRRPSSGIDGRASRPHFSWDDAVAYAKWAGSAADEAEWESRPAAGSKQEVAGDEPSPTTSRVQHLAGRFPHRTRRLRRLRAYRPGQILRAKRLCCTTWRNVWEWCGLVSARPLRYRREHGDRNPTARRKRGCGATLHAAAGAEGRSFLCNDKLLSRYRAECPPRVSPDTGMSHVGFRLRTTKDI